MLHVENIPPLGSSSLPVQQLKMPLPWLLVVIGDTFYNIWSNKGQKTWRCVYKGTKEKNPSTSKVNVSILVGRILLISTPSSTDVLLLDSKQKNVISIDGQRPYRIPHQKSHKGSSVQKKEQANESPQAKKEDDIEIYWHRLITKLEGGFQPCDQENFLFLNQEVYNMIENQSWWLPGVSLPKYLICSGSDFFYPSSCKICKISRELASNPSPPQDWLSTPETVVVFTNPIESLQPIKEKGDEFNSLVAIWVEFNNKSQAVFRLNPRCTICYSPIEEFVAAEGTLIFVKTETELVAADIKTSEIKGSIDIKGGPIVHIPGSSNPHEFLM